jgi:hypothetical protein
LWGLRVTVRDRRSTPCAHEGHIIERCPLGFELAHVRDCDIHDRCTRGHNNGAVMSCLRCPDYKPVATEPITMLPTRNLLMHLCPFASAGPIWRRNVQQLKHRWHLFTGKKIVAIGTGRGMDSPAAVREAFADDSVQYLEFANNPRLREVVSFLPLFDGVASTDPSEATFYCQAKGVTRPLNPGVSVHYWTDLLYECNLDYWPLVEDLLQRHPLAGCFKKVGRGFQGSKSSWHYSGSFMWLRNSAVFARPDWRRIDQHWWGIESWPGIHFSPAEAGCLFHEGRVPQLNLYDMGYLRGTVAPALRKWRAENSGRRTASA